MNSPAEYGLRGLGSGADGEGLQRSSDRPWGDLVSDVLPRVFSRLPFEERLGTLPLVCKAWKNALSDPICWRFLDTEGWFQKRAGVEFGWDMDYEPLVERIVKEAVDRSRGQVEEIRTRHCTDEIINCIADRCPSLTVLSISKSRYVTDKSMTKLASGCPNLRVLDVCDCHNVTKQALTDLGRNCKSLDSLSSNMFYDNSGPNRTLVFRSSYRRDEAVVVRRPASLHHLEMMNTTLWSKGLAYLARGHRRLQNFRLSRCRSFADFARSTARLYVESQQPLSFFGGGM